MEKLFIAGPRKLAPEILLDLQHAGVVQIDPLRTDEMKEYRLNHDEENLVRRWDGVAASSEHALKLLGLEQDRSAKPYAEELDGAEAAASDRERQSAALVEERQRLRDEVELMKQYKEVIDVLAEGAQGLDESRRLAVLPFLLERNIDPVLVEEELTSTLGTETPQAHRFRSYCARSNLCSIRPQLFQAHRANQLRRLPRHRCRPKAFGTG